MTIHLRGDLTRKVCPHFQSYVSVQEKFSFLIQLTFYYNFYPHGQVAPGDVVEFSGIFLPIPYFGFRAMRAGLVADTFLEAMSVTHFKKKYEE